MADPQEILAQRVRHALAAAFGPEHADDDPVIRPSQFADYQANVALPLGKQLGRPPREVAAELAAHLDIAGLCVEPQVSGPGFVNLTLRDEWIATQASQQLADIGLGLDEPDAASQQTPARGRTQRVVVDYSSPNVAKEMHVGHLRTTVVGDAIVRILGRLGHTVIKANHLGDWGTPFGMLIEHMIDVGEAATKDALSVGEINPFYRAARHKFDSDPAFAERSRSRVVALQAGDEETLRLWRVLVDDSKQYYNSIYDRLGITLTDADLAPESFYNPMLADVCAELQESGVARMSDGALCAFPPGFTNRDGQPLPLILRKSDGGYGYDSTDLAAIRYRIRDLKADRLIYLVAAEQSLHFQMLFAVARQAGWLTGEVSAEHAVIGLVTGADGKRLRTRSGETIKLITLIEEAVQRAEQVIGERYQNPAERRQIGEAVGIGALKYADLSVARNSGYALDFDRMLALTGNTGPYLQYATARIRSIFRKAGLDPAELAWPERHPEAATAPIQITEDAERALALRMLSFGATVEQVAETTEPHRLCGYLFELASTFTTFYEKCPVLQADDSALRDSRLALSALTLRVLLTGLGLLGIPVPDRM